MILEFILLIYLLIFLECKLHARTESICVYDTTLGELMWLYVVSTRWKFSNWDAHLKCSDPPQ